MQSSTPSHRRSTVDALSAAIISEKSRASLDLLEALYADGAVARTIPVAVAAGASKSLFGDDHQTLYLAAVVASTRNLSQIELASFARAALREFGYWDDSQVLGNYGSCLWSNVTLAALFEAMFFSAATIEHYVRRLILIRRRERAAREHLEHAARLLSGEAAA